MFARLLVLLVGVLGLTVAASADPVDDYVRAQLGPRHLPGVSLFKDGKYTHGETLRPAIIAPNGGVMMSVLDFATWDSAITSGRLLSFDSRTALTTPVRLSNGKTVSHGLGLPAPVRQRIAAALAAATSFESLGGDFVTDAHFNLNPALARRAWYRARTPSGMRFFTLLMDDGSRVVGVVIEDE